MSSRIAPSRAHRRRGATSSGCPCCPTDGADADLHPARSVEAGRGKRRRHRVGAQVHLGPQTVAVHGPRPRSMLGDRLAAEALHEDLVVPLRRADADHDELRRGRVRVPGTPRSPAAAWRRVPTAVRITSVASWSGAGTASSRSTDSSTSVTASPTTSSVTTFSARGSRGGGAGERRDEDGDEPWGETRTCANPRLAVARHVTRSTESKVSSLQLGWTCVPRRPSPRPWVTC